MLKPELLVKGNSWIEGLTVLSIIVGTVLGGVLIHPDVSHFLMRDLGLSSMAYNRAEAEILVIALVYLAAALFKLMIPKTGMVYHKQETLPLVLLSTFKRYDLIHLIYTL